MHPSLTMASTRQARALGAQTFCRLFGSSEAGQRLQRPLTPSCDSFATAWLAQPKSFLRRGTRSLPTAQPTWTRKLSRALLAVLCAGTRPADHARRDPHSVTAFVIRHLSALVPGRSQAWHHCRRRVASTARALCCNNNRVRLPQGATAVDSRRCPSACRRRVPRAAPKTRCLRTANGKSV